MTINYDDILEYVKDSVVSNNEQLQEDIAWKFAIGDIILTLADQQGLKVEPKSLLDIFDADCLIGDKICCLVRPVQSENNVTSEDDSSESQLNQDEDLG